MSQLNYRYAGPRVIMADPTEYVGPSGSLSLPREWRNQYFSCSACGRKSLWTAAQQQYWFEVVKAHVFATPTLRCTACRKRQVHWQRRARVLMPPRFQMDNL